MFAKLTGILDVGTGDPTRNWFIILAVVLGMLHKMKFIQRRLSQLHLFLSRCFIWESHSPWNPPGLHKGDLGSLTVGAGIWPGLLGCHWSGKSFKKS